ncbi:MAG: PAS domain S-box protein [Acidobacteriota bacterium]
MLPSSADARAILESLIASSSDGIVITDMQGRLLLANAAAEQLLPLRDETPLKRALRGEAASPVEIRVQNEAVPGENWVSAWANPLRDESGRQFGAVLTMRDITDSKRAADRLRKECDWATAIAETVSVIVVVLGRDGRILEFNHAAEAVTGYRAEEVLDKSIWETLLVPGEVEAARQAVKDLRAGTIANQYENHWITKDGRKRLIAWSGSAVAGAGGDAEYILGTGVDITDRKRTEDELRQANQTLRAVIETSPLAIITMDLQGYVKTWNRAAEEIFGWRAVEVIGEFFPIVPPEDEEFFHENLARLARGATISGIERQRRRRDGALINVALWNAPLRDGVGNVIGGISVIADITGRKRLEEDFRQSQKMEAIGRLAGGVAHDFNNLLTVITGYTQMVLDGFEAEHPMRGYVEEIVRASDSAAALTNQLLAFSRRQIVTPQVLDLNTLVRGMDNLLHRLIGEDIELVVKLDAGLPRVKVDEGQFQQVLMNLAVNARDAMPEGGTMTISTGIAAIKEQDPDGIAPGAYVLLSVTDTGKGMSEETQRRIFEPFFTTKSRGKGTGLGLSTVYGIVKQAGGEVTVRSQVGGGTTFRIHLPALERAVAACVENGTLPERKTGTETVLLVEDEPGLRQLVREVLETHGYTVLQAADVREALTMSEAHKGTIHLCLTDMIMPGMSGRDLAERIKQLRPRIRILYMSGYTDHSVLMQGAKDDETTFLQKPFTPDVLLGRVREVLDK